MKSAHIVMMMSLCLWLASCTPPLPTETSTPLPPAATGVKPEIANPASVFCGVQGGKLEIRDETGGQVGYCMFPDGSECEEWAYYRNECTPGAPPKLNMANPASVFCGEQGGKLEIRDETGGQVGYCMFPDGSECEEWTYFRNECVQGQITQSPATNDAFKPITSEECNLLVESSKKTLNVDVISAEAPFLDYLSGLPGRGCQMKAAGTGVNFPDFVTVVEKMKSMLDTAGWKEAIQYSADGPTGSASGYWSGNRICLLNVSWLPSPDAQCGQTPLVDCNLKPEQKQYTITLNCAQEIQR